MSAPRTPWVRRAARGCVRPFVGTRLRPNHITTLRLATGLAATVAFSMGTREWDIVAGFLFAVSCFIDHADGEFARMTGTSTPFGYVYDITADAVTNVLTFAAIGVGLSFGPLGTTALALGLVAAATVGATFVIVHRIESAGERITGRGGVDPEDGLFIVSLAAWFDGLAALLYAAVVGAPAFLAYLGVRYRGLFRRRNAVYAGDC